MTLTLLPSYEELEDHVSEYKGLLSAVGACAREERLWVVQLLDEAIEEELISELDADDILLEWDVNNWPEQLPKPVVEYVRNKPYRLLRPRTDQAQGDEAQLVVYSFATDESEPA